MVIIVVHTSFISNKSINLIQTELKQNATLHDEPKRELKIAIILYYIDLTNHSFGKQVYVNSQHFGMVNVINNSLQNIYSYSKKHGYDLLYFTKERIILTEIFDIMHIHKMSFHENFYHLKPLIIAYCLHKYKHIDYFYYLDMDFLMIDFQTSLQQKYNLTISRNRKPVFYAAHGHNKEGNRIISGNFVISNHDINILFLADWFFKITTISIPDNSYFDVILNLPMYIDKNTMNKIHIFSNISRINETIECRTVYNPFNNKSFDKYICNERINLIKDVITALSVSQFGSTYLPPLRMRVTQINSLHNSTNYTMDHLLANKDFYGNDIIEQNQRIFAIHFAVYTKRAIPRIFNKLQTIYTDIYHNRTITINEIYNYSLY